MAVEIEKFNKSEFKEFEDLKFRRILWGANSFVISLWTYSMLQTEKLPCFLEPLPIRERQILGLGILSVMGITTAGYIYTNTLIRRTLKDYGNSR